MTSKNRVTAFFDKTAQSIASGCYTGRIYPAIGAAVLGCVGLKVGYDNNIERESNVEVAFSEIGKTVRAYEKGGQEVPPLTLYYANLSDFVMKYFESRNYAYSHNRSNATLAGELEQRVDRSLKIHTQMTEIAAKFPAQAQAALKSVDIYAKVSTALAPVTNNLQTAYNDTHNDVYINVPRTVITCDSNNRCSTTTVMDSVYDHTIHTYDYDRTRGLKGAELLSKYVDTYTDLRVNEQMVRAQSTEADNEYAMERSMPERLQHKIPTPQQALMLSNMYVTASMFEQNRDTILQQQKNLTPYAAKWQARAPFAASDQYNTTSHSDSGPADFQLSRAAAGASQALQTSTGEVVEGMRYAAVMVPVMEAKVRAFVSAQLDGKKGDPDALHKELNEIATTLYAKNFKNGLQVDPFSTAEVLLYGFGAGLAGGALGYGATYIKSRRNLQALRKQNPFMR